MIIAQLRMTAVPEKKKDVIQILNHLIGPTEALRGCRLCRLYSNLGIEDELLFITEWEAELSFRQYLASKNFKKILAAMDLAAEKPELSFHTISTTRGLEMLESIGNEKIKMVN